MPKNASLNFWARSNGNETCVINESKREEEGARKSERKVKKGRSFHRFVAQGERDPSISPLLPRESKREEEGARKSER